MVINNSFKKTFLEYVILNLHLLQFLNAKTLIYARYFIGN